MSSQKPIFVRVTKKSNGLGANRMHTFPDDFKMYQCFNVLGRPLDAYTKLKIYKVKKAFLNFDIK